MRDFETRIGSVPMYIFMIAVVFLGPKFLGPIYMALLNLLIGRLPG